ncbi:MAG: 50S ribosomal protein L29 [Clostridia bacterium]|nr:50S ribosomal protein L29 [Clostridia bacterium]
MNAKEIRDLTVAELNEKLADLKDELYKLRFQHAINQLDNPMRITAVKKDIARVQTVLREAELKDSANA